MKNKKFSIVIIAICAGIILFSPIVIGKQPVLSYDPSYYNFGDMIEGSSDSKVFYIWNACCCGCDTLRYTLNESFDWIEVIPGSGFSNGEMDPITVIINTGGLSPGFHIGNISITSNGGMGTIVVKVRVLEKPNSPPIKPYIHGQSFGLVGKTYNYSTSSTDPNGDQVYYKFSWGDGLESNWVGPHKSGQIVTVSHVWTESGKHLVKVKAKDERGEESLWSDPLGVVLPKNNKNNSFFLKVLDTYPNLFPLVRYLLGL